MALDFNEATPQYLERTITLVTAYPFSLVTWLRKDTTNGFGFAVGLTNDSTEHYYLAYTSLEDVEAGTGGGGAATTSGAGANNAWTHATAIFASSTSRTAYRDGANSGTNTDSMAFTTPTVFRIAASQSGFGGEFPGALAEVAVYNIALSATEVAILARGVSPLAVRPDALVAYVPLIGRASAEPDLINGGTMTHVSTPSQFAHPRIIYPGRPKLVLFSRAATQDLTPDLFTNTNTFYTQVVAPGVVSLTPNLFTNSNTFYTQVVSVGAVDLTPSLFQNSNTFYTQVVLAITPLTPDLFVNDNTFYTQVVGVGAVDLAPSLFTNTNVFVTHTVSPGAVDLAPALFTNTNTFYTPVVVVPEVQDLTPDLFTNSNTFYTHTVTPGAVDLTPSLFQNAQTFYTQVVAPGAVTLEPSLFTNGQTFYTQVVSVGAVDLAPELFENTNTFYTQVITSVVALVPTLFTNSNTFYTQVVATGAVDIAPDLFENTNTFYPHTVTLGAYTPGGEGVIAVKKRRVRRHGNPPTWP